MKIVWVAYDTLHKILSLKVLILSLVIVLAIVSVSLAMSDYLTSAGPAWFDLFRKHISQDFLGSLYFFAQMLLTSFVVIICALVAQDVYCGEAEQIYLTGGLSKPTAFIGRILGLAIYILLLWWALFLAAGATLIFTGLGNVDLSMVEIFTKLFLNSVVISLLAWSLVGLTKVVFIGITPILVCQYWLTVNSNITAETAGNALHNAVNFILPLNTFSQFASMETEYVDLLMKYQNLSPWHGAVAMAVFAVFCLLAAMALYITNQDQ